jgi:hypothetical protein
VHHHAEIVLLRWACPPCKTMSILHFLTHVPDDAVGRNSGVRTIKGLDHVFNVMYGVRRFRIDSNRRARKGPHINMHACVEIWHPVSSGLLDVVVGQIALTFQLLAGKDHVLVAEMHACKVKASRSEDQLTPLLFHPTAQVAEHKLKVLCDPKSSNRHSGRMGLQKWGTLNKAS